MGLRDGDFPGRNDKLIWAVMLLFFAPASIWLFRGVLATPTGPKRKPSHGLIPGRCPPAKRCPSPPERARARPAAFRAWVQTDSVGKRPGPRLEFMQGE